MKTQDIDTLIRSIKLDGHGANPLATELHRLACELQGQTDKVHAALDTVRNPKFKGDVVGELRPWTGHFPLELDHSDGTLHDILVCGASVSDHLAPGLWAQAEAEVMARFCYCEQSESQKAKVARMDAADMRSAHAA